jgi:hypothetical protein
MTAPTEHQVVVTRYSAHPHRDGHRGYKRVHFRCTYPNCVVGLIDGTPAAVIDELVGLLQTYHRHV